MPKLTAFLKKPNQLLFFLTLVLLVFITLYPKFPLIKVNGTFVSIRLEDFLISLFLVIWGWVLIKEKLLKSFFKDNLNLAIILYFFIGSVSVFSASFITNTVQIHLGVLHLLRRVEFMLLLPAVYYSIKSKWQQKRSLITLSIVLILVNGYAFGQKFLEWPVVSTTNSEFSKGQILYLTEGARVSSTFAGHYDLAIFLMMALAMLTAMFFDYKGIKAKAWIGILGVSSAVVLILTAARLSFAAAFLGVAYSLFLVGKKKLILALFVIGFLIVLYPSPLRDRLVSTININLQHQGERFTPDNKFQANRSKLNIPTLPNYEASKAAEATFSATRSADIASDIAPGEPVDKTELEIYRSLNIRLNVEWPRAINAFVKNPILGTGFSSLGLATDNDLFRSLGEVGLFGSAALFLIIWEIYKRCFRIYHNSSNFTKFLTAGCISMLTAVLVNGLVIDVFEASKTASLFWMILGLNLASEKFKNQ